MVRPLIHCHGMPGNMGEKMCSQVNLQKWRTWRRRMELHECINQSWFERVAASVAAALFV
jgi:Fe-S cluster biosynthesis and repair protein YggX